MSEQESQHRPDQYQPQNSVEAEREKRINDLMELPEEELQDKVEEVNDSFTQEDRERVANLIPDDMHEARQAVDAGVEEALSKLDFENTDRREAMAQLYREELAERYANQDTTNVDPDGDPDAVAALRAREAQLLGMEPKAFEEFTNRWQEYDDTQNAVAEIEYENSLRMEAEALNNQFERRKEGLSIEDKMTVDGVKYEVRNIETDEHGDAKFATISMEKVDEDGNPTGRRRVIRDTMDYINTVLPEEMTGAKAPESEDDTRLDRMEEQLGLNTSGEAEQPAPAAGIDDEARQRNLDYIHSILNGGEASTNTQQTPPEGTAVPPPETGPAYRPYEVPRTPENGGPQPYERPMNKAEWARFARSWDQYQGPDHSPYDGTLEHQGAPASVEKRSKKWLRRAAKIGAAVMVVAGAVSALIYLKDPSGVEGIATAMPDFGDKAGAALENVGNAREAANFYPDSITSKSGDSLWNIGRDMLEKAGIHNPDVAQLDAVKDALVSTNETFGANNQIGVDKPIDTTAGKAVIERLLNR